MSASQSFATHSEQRLFLTKVCLNITPASSAVYRSRMVRGSPCKGCPKKKSVTKPRQYGYRSNKCHRDYTSKEVVYGTDQIKALQ